MNTINILEYRKSIEPNKATKIKVFTEFFCSEFTIKAQDDNIDVRHFQDMDIDFIIKSLGNYIVVNNVRAQNTADTYVKAVYELLEYISDKYGATNAIFTNMRKNKEFSDRTKEVTSQLRATISKDIATDDDYESLVNCVESFLQENDNIELKLNEEIDLFISGERKNLRIFTSFLSILAAICVMVYALKYNVITELKSKDIDIIDRKIKINGISLPLNMELEQLLKIYMPIRTKLINFHRVNTDSLFIKYKTGQQLIKDDFSYTFQYIRNNLNGFKSEEFSSRRILEMLDRGIDISSISQLTGFDIKRCAEIQANNSTTDILIEFLSGKKDINSSQFMSCPFCGTRKKANIENWIIVKFEGDDNKYVACKGCKGLANREHI
ncbi:hypothetical protein EDD70_1092 [Hydrogenoanaerobacterium saccharovorans]|uniref:Uncharacterized protein n=1 Tax=Hydrogenoanaerobacterium saccharovorans TaxID=474960 RepID=A0A1H8A259_9FIRM|nr:hypothetical protein [Hydrogenoanaerobacterium saccharovorans]RPF48277.1 hypothetical protein EDD70_1092 [Hydrogenoanaerobacterium saccharovorans]SEM63637.1 hypothetical protein SAMN05216180_0999 [Hydrogenoanaerobacterium saccharovorans]